MQHLSYVQTADPSLLVRALSHAPLHRTTLESFLSRVLVYHAVLLVCPHWRAVEGGLSASRRPA